MDLLGEHLAEGAAEHREVLREDEDLASLDGAPAGDDTVGVGALLDAGGVGPVAGEHVELVERALVEEVLDALAGEHLALGALTFDGALGARVEGLLLALAELLDALGEGDLGHAGQATPLPRTAPRPRDAPAPQVAER